MNLLASDDSGDDEKPTLKINENYANKYDTWRNKEELQKCNCFQNRIWKYPKATNHFIFLPFKWKIDMEMLTLTTSTPSRRQAKAKMKTRV